MKWFGISIAVVILTSATAAHHSFSAEFDSTKPVTLSGTIAGLRWANPHAWIYVEVKDAEGVAVRWSVETVAANQLYRAGWRLEDATIGAQITVVGFLARNGTPTANATRMTLADGRVLFSGDGPQRPAP